MELAFTLGVKILLALMGLVNAMQMSFDYRLVLALFTALAFSFAVQLPKNRTLSMTLCALFCLLPLALPELLCFLALIVFDACYRREALPLLAVLPAFFVIRPPTGLLVLILVGCLLAALLALALSWLLRLRAELQAVKDEAESETRTASRSCWPNTGKRMNWLISRSSISRRSCSRRAGNSSKRNIKNSQTQRATDPA